MGRPSKPVAVLESEGKSHRTKAELEARKKAEQAIFSGEELKARSRVRKNKIANAEFTHIKKLMKSIGKNDALYSSGINTYCQLYAEVEELELEREQVKLLAEKLEEKFDTLGEMDYEDIIAFTKQVTRLVQQRLSISALIDKKRKMMLDIDKENLMTLSSAMRSIPKTPEKVENPLLKILSEEVEDEE